MELWLDTAEIEIIKQINKMGLLFGVTTNPSILAKTQRVPEAVIKEILDIQSGPIAVQVTATTAVEMLHQARRLRAFSSRLIIKIPATPSGYEAMAIMNQENIPVMATAILKAPQALLSSVLQAQYVAPYLGHMLQENNRDEEFNNILTLIRQQKMNTKVIAAAIKDIQQVIMCANLGVAAITLPPTVFTDLVTSPTSTLKSLDKFMQDWENTPKASKLFAISA